MPILHDTFCGDLYVPPTLELEETDVSVRRFSGGDLQRFAKIFESLRRGALVVLEGREQAIGDVMRYVQKKKDELSPRRPQRAGGRRAGREQTRALERIGVVATPADVLQLEPPRAFPRLLELLGGSRQERSLPYFVPWLRLVGVEESLSRRQRVDALDIELMSAPHVLVPRSQETTDCFAEALGSVVAGGVREGMRVLDMGCGSGCLTLLAARHLASRSPHVVAADLLPEALACTKLNLEHALEQEEHPLAQALRSVASVSLFGPTDLYAELPSAWTFDLVLFNAPWIEADVRSRSEVAINDPGRRTLRAFFAQSKPRLAGDGRILLGYADGGQRSGLVEAEALAAEQGLRVLETFKRRVATHRKHNKWQNNVVLVLGHG